MKRSPAPLSFHGHLESARTANANLECSAEQTGAIAVCFGTRPEAIKLFPLVRELASRETAIPTRLICTGQHEALLDACMELLPFVPSEHLGVFEARQPLHRLVSRMLEGMGDLFRRARPRAVVVQGDTASSFAAALAAFYERIPVVHLEAGLRTHDLGQPFPEEMQRVFVSRVATLHLAPTESARQNLLSESVLDEAIVVVGNTGQDALRLIRDRANVPLIDGWDARRPYAVVTLHRRETSPNVGAIALGIRRGVIEAGIQCVVVLHPNDSVSAPLRRALSDVPGVILSAPMPFGAMVALCGGARFVVTDSGGVQEEAAALGVPALIARDKTDRPESLEAGVAVLVRHDPGLIARSIVSLASDDVRHAAMARRVEIFGDGFGAGRAADAIEARFPTSGVDE